MTVAVRTRRLDQWAPGRCPACAAFLPGWHGQCETVCTRCGAAWEAEQ